MRALVTRKNQLLFIAFLLVMLQVERSSEQKANVRLSFRSIEHNFNPNYIDSLISNISADRSSLNLSLNQIKDVPVDFWLKVSLLYKQQASKKYRSMMALDINVCELMRSELNHQSLVHLWIANMLKYSNMPRQCPWKAGSYYCHNLRPDVGSVPKFIFTGLYRIDSQFYLKSLKNDLYTNITIIFATHRK